MRTETEYSVCRLHASGKMPTRQDLSTPARSAHFGSIGLLGYLWKRYTWYIHGCPGKRPSWKPWSPVEWRCSLNLVGPEPRGRGAMVKYSSLDFTHIGDLRWKNKMDNMGMRNGIIIRTWIVFSDCRGWLSFHSHRGAYTSDVCFPNVMTIYHVTWPRNIWILSTYPLYLCRCMEVS